MSSRSYFRNWLNERFPYEQIVKYFRHKEVPDHRKWIWYLFGGLILFLVGIQVFSGILLSLNYSPEPGAAYDSERRIINEIPYGWLIHSAHAWGANLIIGVTLVHMFSVLMLKSYRKPRELMWVSGVLSLLILLGFAFTGTLLPWDTTAYFATLIGTEVPKTMPIVGSLGVNC